jgi:hypothetical protein
MKKYLVFVFISAVMWSCGTDDEQEKCAFTPDAAPVSLAMERFEDSLVNFSSKQQMVDFFTRYPLIRDYVFKRTQYQNDSAFINKIYARLSNPHLDTLLMETKRTFGDGSKMKKEFEQAFANLRYYYPNARLPKIQTVISGLETDLLVTDTLIIVGLDMYLGEKGKYRPQVYDYILRQYNPENIVPSCMLIYGIDGLYNKTDITDKTVLADMIAYGKSFYFAKQMLPCVPDSILIWYSAEEIRGARKNQDLIWARLIQDEVLYETSHLVKQSYLGERPKTIEVGPECPGRIGQFVGWQIVNAYMKSHPTQTLPSLMEISNARALFDQSGYKPKRR